jgi:hypothetical protein
MSFSVSAGQRVAFDVDRPVGSTLDSYLRLFDATGAELAFNDDGPHPLELLTPESYLVYTFPTAGLFYVGVSGFDNWIYNPLTGEGDISGTTGAYTLTIESLSGADGDPDDQISEAFGLGAMTTTRTRTGQSISPGADVDMMSFTVTAGQRIDFDIDLPAGSGLDPYLRLFNSSGVQLAANDDGPHPDEGFSLESYLQHTFSAGGTYYVGVSSFGNENYDAATGAGDASGETGAYTLILSAGHSEPITGFSIDLTFSGLSAAQIGVFNEAADRWEQIIIGDLPNATYNGQTVDDIRIDASAVFIDGPGQVLGQATNTHLRTGSSLPIRGFMQFDTADLANMEATGKLMDVILHEMGHVLGVGTLWDNVGLLVGAGSSDPRFVGTQATAAYNAIFGTNATGVPVHNADGPGSRDSHWRESLFGNELMSPFIGGTPNPISRVTVGSLADLGYTVNMNAADAYTPSALALAAVSAWDGPASAVAALAEAPSIGFAGLDAPRASQGAGAPDESAADDAFFLPQVASTRAGQSPVSRSHVDRVMADWSSEPADLLDEDWGGLALAGAEALLMRV